MNYLDELLFKHATKIAISKAGDNEYIKEIELIDYHISKYEINVNYRVLLVDHRYHESRYIVIPSTIYKEQ